MLYLLNRLKHKTRERNITFSSLLFYKNFLYMANEDIKFLDYDGLTEYHNNITGKIFIPTINFIPNETTLTYRINEKLFKFDIGDFVRVVDSTKVSGFKFYQLYDITEQNEAIWGSYSEKSSPTFTAPTAKELTFDGTPQELLNPGSTSDGVIQYSILTSNRTASDSYSWSTSVPTATEAGDYTVYWRLVGDGSHSDIQPTAISCGIGKKIPTYAAPTAKSLTYNGFDQLLLNAGTTEDGTIEYSYDSLIWSTFIPQATNAGSHTVYWKLIGDSNHLDIDSTQIVVTIAKAAGSVTIIPVDAANTYNGTAQELIIAGSGTGTMYYRLGSEGDFLTTIPSTINAGTYTVQYYAAESANYLQSSTDSISATIVKADPSYTAPTIKNLVYTSLSQQLLNEGNSTDGIVKYSMDEETWSTTIPSRTNAGTYTVYWKVFGDSNHNDTSSASLSVTITKVTPTVVAPTAISNLVYSREGQELINQGSTDWGTLQYSLDNENYSTDIPEGINAGDYTIWYKVQGDSNINDVAAASILNSIAKADAAYVAPTAKSLVYSGESQELLNSGSTSDGTIQYSSDNDTWSSNIPEGTDAGTHTSYWKIIGDSNHNDKVSASIETIIDKHAALLTAPTAISSLIYDSTSQELINAGSGSGVMQYKLDNGSWDTVIPSAIDADTYTIYYKTLESSNYYGSDGSDYITNTIAKVTPTVTAPTPRVLTYNTTSQALILAGSTNWGTLQYSLDDSTWSTNIPEAINYDSYTVYYRVVGNSNINNVASASVACSIAEKRVSTPTIELNPTEYTYNGNECEPSVVVKDEGQVVPPSEYTVSYTNNINAGTATVVITDNTAGNYNITGTKDFTINKATGSVITAPTAKTLTYNSSAQALVNAGQGTGTIYYRLGTSGNFSTDIPTATNADTYTVYYYAAESTNYNQSTPIGSVSVTIYKVTPTVTAPTAKSLSYTGNSLTLANAGSTNYGTLQYSSDNSSWSTTIPSGTNAGNYTVYYRVVGDSNINDVASSSIACSIAKADCTYTAPTAKTGLVYTGSAQVLLNAGSATGGTIYYSGDNSSWNTSLPTATSAGNKTCYWYIAGDANHNDKSSTSLTVNIAKAAGSVTTAPVNTNYTYNGTARVVASNGVGTGTMYYRLGASGSFSTTMPTMTNAGSNTLYYYAAASTNYTQSATGSITVSVQKANQTAPTAYGATADYGSTATATASGGGGQGSLEWSNGSTRTAIGSQTTKARWAGNTNYNASSWSNEVTLTVRQGHAGHEYVEIGGLKWATMNVGASSVTDYGKYFQWGDAQGYTASQVGSGSGKKYFGWADYKYGNGTSSPGNTGMTKYKSTDGKTILDLSDDAARANWGGQWRMPTIAEYVALGNAVNTAWTASYQGSGVAGLVCTDKTDSSKVLFFPAAGYCFNGSVRSVGSDGSYWSSSLLSQYVQGAFRILFDNSGVGWQGNESRCYGAPVRGVVG